LAFNQTAGIDLHIHSTASDGSLSPVQILQKAERLGLKAIGITDHDSLEGSRAALLIGSSSSMGFLTGVEISASPPPGFRVSGSFHILGYAIRLDHPGLNTALETQRQARKARNPQIIKRLNDLGMTISDEQLQAEFPHAQIGRPHIAQLMLRKGYARSIDDAFDRFIGKGRPAYVEKYRMSCSSTIETIRQAGGFAVLAHPSLLKVDGWDTFQALVSSMKDLGLAGLEAYYPEHSPEQTKALIDMAERHDLLVTGGTDFHGAINPEIEMGSGKGSFRVPYQVYEAIMNRFQHSVRAAALTG